VEVKLGLLSKEAIAQNIRTLILTEKGEIPFRPKMGIGSTRLLGKNLDKMAMSLEIIDQLNTYEPRIEVKRVNFLPTDNPSHVRIALQYVYKETGEELSYFLEI
jgi:phage baseplate assembly protein W